MRASTSRIFSSPSAVRISSTGKDESPMEARVTGTTMPVLECILQPNESIISEAGELSWMTSSIQMTTHTQMGGGGGFFGAFKRVAGGGGGGGGGWGGRRRAARGGWPRARQC